MIQKAQTRQERTAVVSLLGVTAAAIWGHCSKLQVLAYLQTKQKQTADHVLSADQTVHYCLVHAFMPSEY